MIAKFFVGAKRRGAGTTETPSGLAASHDSASVRSSGVCNAQGTHGPLRPVKRGVRKYVGKSKS